MLRLRLPVSGWSDSSLPKDLRRGGRPEPAGGAAARIRLGLKLQLELIARQGGFDLDVAVGRKLAGETVHQASEGLIQHVWIADYQGHLLRTFKFEGEIAPLGLVLPAGQARAENLVEGGGGQVLGRLGGGCF